MSTNGTNQNDDPKNPQFLAEAEIKDLQQENSWASKTKSVRARILGYCLIFIIPIIIILGIIMTVRSCSSPEANTQGQQTLVATLESESNQSISIRINGKDTLVTVGEFFPVPYQAEKPKNFTLEFNFNKHSDYRMENQNDDKYCKQTKSGAMVRGNESLPESWENGNLYIWGKAPGVAYFRIYKPGK